MKAEQITAAFSGSGHVIDTPAQWRAPIVFATPHSGRTYPPAFLAASSLRLSDLQRNEDALVDELFACVTALGAPLLKAVFPRCYVDVNRAEDDLPPHWQDKTLMRPTASDLHSAAYRARLGLGVIPLIINEHLPIYAHPPSRTEAQARIAALHRPYHRDLTQLLMRTREAFGHAILIDCHSMPGLVPVRKKRGRSVSRADIVLGDGHGRTAHARTVDLLEDAFLRRGYHVVRNHPYAGGYATLHHGQPKHGVEAIQIEINRDLYFDARAHAPHAGFDELKSDLEHICAEFMAAIAGDLSEAAE